MSYTLSFNDANTTTASHLILEMGNKKYISMVAYSPSKQPDVLKTLCENYKEVVPYENNIRILDPKTMQHLAFTLLKEDVPAPPTEPIYKLSFSNPGAATSNLILEKDGKKYVSTFEYTVGRDTIKSLYDTYPQVVLSEHKIRILNPKTMEYRNFNLIKEETPSKPDPLNDGGKTCEKMGIIAKLLSLDDKTLFRDILKESGFNEDQLIKSFSNTRGYQEYLKSFLPLITDTGLFKKYDMKGYNAQILDELMSRNSLDKELLEYFYNTLTYDEKKIASEKAYKNIQDITNARKHENSPRLQNKIIVLSKYAMMI